VYDDANPPTQTAQPFSPSVSPGPGMVRRAGGYRDSMTTTPNEPVSDPEVVPAGDPVAPGEQPPPEAEPNPETDPDLPPESGVPAP
jgi:hypothetical protein